MLIPEMGSDKQFYLVYVNGVDEWVRAWDWRSDGRGFESRYSNFVSELWQFHLPALSLSITHIDNIMKK